MIGTAAAYRVLVSSSTGADASHPVTVFRRPSPAATPTRAARRALPAAATAPSQNRYLIRARFIARAAAVFSVVVGALVLGGWLLHIDALTGVLPGFATMKFNTALCFVLSGAALWALLPYRPSRRAHIVAQVTASLVTVASALTLLEYLTGASLGIDQALFHGDVASTLAPFPGRMSGATAIDFALLGVALLALDSRAQRWSRALATCAGAIAAVSLLGYLYGVSSLYSVGQFSTIGFHTAAAFLILAIGTLNARPLRGMMKLLTAESLGGLALRRLLPVAVLLPPVLGWLRLLGQRAGWFGAEFGVAGVVTVTVLVLIMAFWWSALSLERADGERRVAARALFEGDEVRRLNQELSHQVTETQTLNQELEAFCYSVSHDLRAPLRGIDGFSKAVLEEYRERLDDTGADYLHRIRKAAQRMAQLIDDLLKLSRAGRTALAREPVDLSVMAKALLADLQQEEPARQIEAVIPPGLRVHADPQLMQVVLGNLLSNAWKFTAPRSAARIELGVQRRDGESALFVRDNGVGFDMAHAGKLFGAFQRLHAMHEFAGTGVGLATVKRIVERHGGRIWADAAPDCGATFYFTLGGDSHDEQATDPPS